MQMIALLAAAAAAGPITEPALVEVDHDRAYERLVPEVVEDAPGYRQRRVVLEDGCGRFTLLRPHDTIARMEAREVDAATTRREIVVEGRSGASGRYGTTRVLRMDRCRPRALFSYDLGRPPYRPPRGWYVTTYGVRVARGRLRLDEYLARAGRPAVTASRRRTSTWRYARGRFTRRSVRYGRA